MPLPKFEDWQAPWEKSGEELDPEKVKRLVYNLHRDIEVEKTSLADAKQALATVTTDRDTVKSELDTLKRGDESEADRLRRENEELKNRTPEADPAVALENLKLKVALRKGLTEFQLKRLAGSTEEELEADADELLEAFGGNGQSGEGEPKDDPVSRRPKPVHNRRAPEGEDNGNLPPYTPKALEELIPFTG